MILARWRRRARLTALSLLSSAPAAAQVRHEFLPPGFFEAHPVGPDAVLDDGGELPRSVRRDGVELEAPDPTTDPGPSFGGAGSGEVGRRDSIQPDRKTTIDEPLTYHAMFNPSVAPFRRDSVFDVVRPDYELVIGKGALRPAPTGPRKGTAGRELFWGDIQVTVEDDRPHPIPSVAPDMRILAIEGEGADVQIMVDSADNYYLISGERGPLRLRMLVDADGSYFSGALPGHVPLQVNADHPMARLPAAIRARGQRVLSALNVRVDGPFGRELDKLVTHFRNFTAGTLPPGQGDIYLDLALGGVGVCRHRAFAFIVTARAAGVPTRFVANEAHAFAEILAPDGRWRRVDLGGESPRLDLEQGAGRRLHQPPPDPFTKPAPYLSSYSNRMATGDVPPEGAPDDPPDGGATLAGAPQPLGGPSGGPGGQGVGRDSPSGEGGPTKPAEGEGPGAQPTESSSAPDLTAPPGDQAGGEPSPSEGAVPFPQRIRADGPGRPVRVSLTAGAAPGPVYRGEPLPFAFSGAVTTVEGDPRPGVTVQIYLVPEDGVGSPRPLGGALTTDPRGRFQVQGQLPADLELGRYTVQAVTEAGRGWASGISQ